MVTFHVRQCAQLLTCTYFHSGFPDAEDAGPDRCAGILDQIFAH